MNCYLFYRLFVSYLPVDEDLPIFPVAEKYLTVVRDRVALARKIDVQELRARRQNADVGWLMKSAKEMDILIDDENLLSDSKHLHDFDAEYSDNANQIKARRDLKNMKSALKHLLAQPIFPKGFSYKYPGTNFKIESSHQNAVNVMRDSTKKSMKNQ